MDVSQIASLATSLDNQNVSSQVQTLMLKKVLDNQQSTAASLIQSIPQLPANPAIGRNVNVAV